MAGFELSPGIVIDPERDEAYVMDPRGEIVAIALAKGEEVWRSQQAAKPLTLSGQVLVGQAEQPGLGDGLKIVALNTSKQGEEITESVVPLPPNVHPAIDQGAARSFTARAAPEAGETTVSWEFIEQPVRGVATGPFQVLPGETPPALSSGEPAGFPTAASATVEMSEPGAQPTVMRGAARINLASGAVASVTAPHLAAAADAPAVQATATDASPAALAGVPQPQFLSADGRHILSSQRVAGDPEWDKYRWELFDRESGALIGSFRTHLRYAPFSVTNGRAIYHTPPYARRMGEKLLEQPPQIHGMDLASGAHLWSHPVRDTVDRRPRPP